MALLDIFRRLKQKSKRLKNGTPTQKELDLAESIINDPEFAISGVMVKELTYKKLVLKVSHEAKNKVVRDVAAQMLDENIKQSEWIEIANNSVNSYERAKAVSHIKDQSILENIAREAKDSGMRVAAIKKIEDISILKDIVRDEKNYAVKKAAEKRTKEKSKLQETNRNYHTKSQSQSLLRTSQKLNKLEDLCRHAVSNAELRSRNAFTLQERVEAKLEWPQLKIFMGHVIDLSLNLNLLASESLSSQAKCKEFLKVRKKFDKEFARIVKLSIERGYVKNSIHRILY